MSRTALNGLDYLDLIIDNLDKMSSQIEELTALVNYLIDASDIHQEDLDCEEI